MTLEPRHYVEERPHSWLCPLWSDYIYDVSAPIPDTDKRVAVCVTVGGPFPTFWTIQPSPRWLCTDYERAYVCKWAARAVMAYRQHKAALHARVAGDPP